MFYTRKGPLLHLAFVAVEISGTSSVALLGTIVTMTCSLVDSDVPQSSWRYRWRVGGSVQQGFDTNNEFVVYSVGVSDARGDYKCEVRETGTGPIFSATTALNVTS